MSTNNSTLAKFWNIRNVLALSFTAIFAGLLTVWIFYPEYGPPEMIIGAAIAQITLIIQFYFRRAEPQ